MKIDKIRIVYPTEKINFKNLKKDDNSNSKESQSDEFDKVLKKQLDHKKKK